MCQCANVFVCSAEAERMVLGTKNKHTAKKNDSK
jgi:hypothetical protein